MMSTRLFSKNWTLNNIWFLIIIIISTKFPPLLKKYVQTCLYLCSDWVLKSEETSVRPENSRSDDYNFQIFSWFMNDVLAWLYGSRGGKSSYSRVPRFSSESLVFISWREVDL
jgi:hypothetical protein